MKALFLSFIFVVTELCAAPKVVVSLGPVYSIVCGLTAGITKPQLLMPPNASHHDYSPTPKNIIDVKQADLVVWVAAGLEEFMPNLIEKFKKHNIEFGAIPGIRKIADSHHHDEYDPHLWLDPGNCLLLVDAVSAHEGSPSE